MKLNFDTPLLRDSRLHAALTALLLAVTFYLFVFHPARGNLIDFRIYYEAAGRMALGQDIYQPPYQVESRDGRIFTLHYLYPPFLAWLLTATLEVPYESLKLVWAGLNFLALIFCAGLVAKLLTLGAFTSWSTLERFLVSLFFLSCFEPVYNGIMDGQVHVLILLLLLLTTVGMTDAQRPNRHSSLPWSRAVLVSLSLTCATLLKMSPALLYIGVVFQRQLRTLIISGLVAALFGILFFYVGPPIQSYASFFNPLESLLSGELSREFIFNFATDKSVLTIVSLDSSPSARVAVRIIALLFPLLVSFYLWGRRIPGAEVGSSPLRILRLFGFLTALMVIASPLVWFHHLTWTIIPLLVLAIHAPDFGQAKLKHLTLVASLYFLVSQVNQVHVLALRELPSALGISALLPTIYIVTMLVWLAKLEWDSQQLSRRTTA